MKTKYSSFRTAGALAMAGVCACIMLTACGSSDSQDESSTTTSSSITTNTEPQNKNICGADGSTACEIGVQGPAGGIIFMDPSTPGNTSGLFYEAAPSFWSSSLGGPKSVWGDPKSVWCDVSDKLIGVVVESETTENMDGRANTDAMLDVCKEGAANLADEYSVKVNDVAYDDWFLPSKGELNQMYLNKSAIAGLAPSLYWSSSEREDGFAWDQYFGDFGGGSQDFGLKSHEIFVRPVRAFK
jgi:hypothetical protein